MFNNLVYVVTFANPKRTFEGDFKFNEGLTAITGPNGKGKSLILELSQYALFGSAALRGKADDYVELKVSLRFTVNKCEYIVTRNGSKVVLRDSNNDTDIASGTKPVNARILQLFGYSYDVFKVANLAAQGEIEKLGEMAPVARKKLVDETIGLTALDELTTFIQKEITSTSGIIKGLEPLVVKPIEPVVVEGLQDADFYTALNADLLNVLQERAVYRVAAERVLVEPVAVVLHTEDARLEEYEAVEQQRKNLLLEAGVLIKQIQAIPEATGAMAVRLHEQDAQLESFKETSRGRQRLSHELQLLKAEEVLIPATKFTRVELTSFETQHDLIKRWSEKQKLIAKRVPHDCPACQHHWDDEDPRIKSEYGEVPDIRPEDPQLTLRQIATEDALLGKQLRKLELQESIKFKQAILDAGTDIEPVVVQIEAARRAYADAEVERSNRVKKDELKVALATLNERFDKTNDHTPVTHAIKLAREAHARYTVAAKAYADALVLKTQATVNLQAIPADLDNQLLVCADNLRMAHAYALNLKNYEADLLKYNQLQAQLDQYKSDLEDWQNGKAAVLDLRAKVKGYILPSLNAVASKLINEMTGGELSWVVISEDFDITVEGTRIELLSGAGKGVANLALRLALGQVLTNSVFPCLLLDEVDASFDDERAAHTAACLKRLTNVFKQVVIVSHKSGVEADHLIQL